MNARSHPPSLAALCDLLLEEGVTHVTGLPDSVSAPLLSRLAARGVPGIAVTREGEAFGIAAGLWLGGAVPLVVLQNTGLLESGDALRGTVLRMGMPLVMVVTCRGYATLAANALVPDSPRGDRVLLVRADVDTVALFTEPTLTAWGVPYVRCDAASDLDAASRMCKRAREEQRTVAILLTAGLSD